MAETEQSKAPTTTAEQDRYTFAARSINRTWEYTQAAIAVMVIGTVLFSTVWLIMHDEASRHTADVILVGAFNLVVGFYFGRTNHARTGGMVDRDR